MQKSPKSNLVKYLLLSFVVLFSACSVFASSAAPDTTPLSVKKTIPMRLVSEEQKGAIRKRPSTLILFGRHGTTASNQASVTHAAGAKDSVTLVPEDCGNIVLLNMIRSVIGGVYCAPSPRCYETAKLLTAGDPSKKVIQEPRFREQNFGILSGKSTSEIIKQKEFLSMLKDPNYRISGGGESMQEVVDRLLIGLDCCSQKSNWQPIYICSSRGCMVALEKYIKGIEFPIVPENPDSATIQKVINLYSVHNYDMLLLRYYFDAAGIADFNVIEQLLDSPVSPLGALSFLMDSMSTENPLISAKAAQLLEAAQMASPKPSPAPSPVMGQSPKF